MIVANHIKKSLHLWERDNITDKIVIESMEKLSKGRLTLPSDTELVDLRQNTNNNGKRKSKKRAR